MLLLLNEFARDIERIEEFIKNDFGPGQIMNITCFTQTWSSTALGFGGWGGSALSPAVTTVVEIWGGRDNRQKHYVFFGHGFAYSVDGEPNEAFKEDMKRGVMKDVETAKKMYYDEEEFKEK